MYRPFLQNFVFSARGRSAERIRRNQWRAFQEAIAYAYDRVPFHRDKWRSASIRPEDIRDESDIDRIPVTTREELVEAGDRILARGYTADECMRSTTSGVSGMPFTSCFDPVAWALLKYASKYRARRHCGLSRRGRAVNLAPLDRAEAEALNAVCRRRDPVFRLRYCSIWNPMEETGAFLNAFRPEAWYGLGSYLVDLAEWAERTRASVAAPKMVFTSGELLTDRTRRTIEERFGAPVYDIYGCTELKEIAWQCALAGGYHINEDLYLVEFLDRGQRSDRGAITVTSFVNRAMPLIRYQTGDEGERIAGRCGCGLGFSMMRPTGGRCIDRLKLPGGGSLSPYRLTVAIEKVPGVGRYRVAQIAETRIAVEVVPSRNAPPGLAAAVESALRRALPAQMEIEVALSDRIPRDRSGKARCVVCEI